MPETINLHDDPDFAALVLAANEVTGAPAALIAKDYWLTEALSRLCSSSNFRVIFKGGTSLSKGWAMIQRFSEDIDLLVEPLNGQSLGQAAAESLLRKVEKEAVSTAGLILEPKHPIAIKGTGKKPPRRVSVLTYPGAAEAAEAGASPYIKIEMAIHPGGFPSTKRPMRSLLAEAILKRAPDAAGRYGNLATFDVACLDPLRTLAEKVCLLAKSHDDGTLVQMVRHYYDIYYLLGDPIITSRLGSAEHASIKTSIKDIDRLYDSATRPDNHYTHPGTSPAFTPDPRLLAILEREYTSSAIYYGERPRFEAILARIATSLKNL